MAVHDEIVPGFSLLLCTQFNEAGLALEPVFGGIFPSYTAVMRGMY